MSRWLCVILAFGMIPVATVGGRATNAADSGPRDWASDATSQMVFHAVLEGLYTDGVSNEIVDRILGKDAENKGGRFETNFVYCCPLCHPAYEAFRLYRCRDNFYGRKDTRNTFGGGLEPGLERRLKSAKAEERRAALQETIQRWVALRLESMRLTRPERAMWSERLEELKKEGMVALEKSGGIHAGWKGCPTCDGSAGACKLRP